jgi:hypothetical protein
MNKKTKIIVIIILSIILIGSLVWLYFEYIDKQTIQDFSEIEVKEEVHGEYKTINIPKIDLSFDVPSGYVLEKAGSDLYFYSAKNHDITWENVSELIGKDWIVIRTSYTSYPIFTINKDYLSTYDYFQDLMIELRELNIVEDHFFLEETDGTPYYMVKIDGRDAICNFNKYQVNDDLYIGNIEIDILLKNKIYRIDAEYGSDTENYEEIINNILESIKIK